MSKILCNICKKEIKQPIYWVDPKFYDIPNKLYLCDSVCSAKIYKKIKHLLKQ